jgi:hypothetical protein
MYSERLSAVSAESIVTVPSRLSNADLAAALDGRTEAVKNA